MTEDPIKLVKRDLRELVEAEIKRFIERYEDCEVVDSIHTCYGWSFYVVNNDVLLHGLSCDVKRKFDLNGNVVMEDITCYVEIDGKHLGWVRVVHTPAKCFIETNVDEVAIDREARKIVKMAEKEAGAGE